ncbi:MAG: transposase [Cytophagaceae bacterium SCN 52-12]|nr:MAG: transposase [Cytophagaceae bacterium SCN 52-12]
MANTYHQIFLHFVFAVKYRKAVIQASWKFSLFGVIGNLINESGGKVIIVNGVEDHVHCFAEVKPAVSVSELMKKVKARSSKYINDHGLTPVRFEWQEGYGAFSYSRSQVKNVYRYIQNQEEHHRKQTFKEEYIGILEDFKVEFEDRFLFQEPV